MEHHSPPPNVASLVLVTLGWFFEGISELTAENVYTWTFRILSVVSLVLMIIINYPKAKETLKERRKWK